MENGNYVPDGLVHIQQGGSLVQFGDDNIDINTEIIDGKDTFHKMGTVILQDQKTGVKNTTKIPR